MSDTSKTRILLVDNYDSFTFNLLHMMQVIPGVELTVARNDADFLPDLDAGAYDGVVISPGPGSADDLAYFGRNMDVISTYGLQGLPVLGVCLGFQGIFSQFGGKLKQAALPVHGKVSQIDIRVADPILDGVPDRSNVMRYHSIIADTEAGIPDCLEATAWTIPQQEFSANGPELMALRHRDLPIYGVQFHPESFATTFGKRMIRNFCAIATEHRKS